MANDHAPRMSNESYFEYLERGASSRNSADVRELRHEVMQRWHGDARADDLAEALYAHEERLAEAEVNRRSRASDSRVISRFDSRPGR